MVLGPRGGEAAIVFSPLVVEVSCCGFSLPTNNSVVLHFLALDSWRVKTPVLRLVFEAPRLL